MCLFDVFVFLALGQANELLTTMSVCIQVVADWIAAGQTKKGPLLTA